MMEEKKESRRGKWLSLLYWELLDLLLFAGWYVIRRKLDESTWQFFSRRRKLASQYRTDADTSETVSDM